jgi:alpha-galactosidase
MKSWVTDAVQGKIPLEIRFHVSMAGSSGVDGNLLQWSDAKIKEASLFNL